MAAERPSRRSRLAVPRQWRMTIAMTAQRTLDLLHHLASRPGHDEVKADFRSLLIEEFGADLHAPDFERRVPEVRGGWTP